MGIVIKKSSRVLLLTYIGFFVGYLNMLLLLPYVFRPEEIGLIRLMLAISAMFATLASFGAPQIATKYFPYFTGSDIRRSTFIKSLLVLTFFGALLFSLVLIILKNLFIGTYSVKSPMFIDYFWYLVPLTASLIFFGITEAIVIVQGKPAVPAFIREIYTRLLLTISAVAFLFSLVSFTGFIRLVSLLYILAPFILIVYGYKKNLLPHKGSVFTIHKNEISEIAKFGFFAFLGNAGAIVLTNIDSIVLSAYSGLVSTGIYSIALFITVVIEIPKRSLSQVLVPMVVKANKEEDTGILEVLYKKSSINQFIIGGMIFLIIWLNIDSIFSLIPHGEVYSAGKWVVFWISLGKLFDMFTGINSEIIGTSRYYRTDLVIFFILNLIGIGLNFILIPSYGVIGAAVAAFSSIILYNTVRFIFIAIVMRIQPFTGKTFIAVTCFAVTFITVGLFPKLDQPVFDIALRSLFITLIFGGTIIALKVSEDISATFRKVITRFFTKN
jgi:O-antigen/teichoic acid export membrane protein